MGIITAHSSKETVRDIVSDIGNQTSDFNPNAVIYFASSRFDPESLSQQMQEQFKNASLFGCSTAGEIVSGKMLKGSVAAMLFDSESIADICISVVENILSENHIPDAFGRFEAYYRTLMAEMDFEKYVGIILADGLSGAEEKLMEKIGDLTDVVFIGASAGDDLKFKQTYIYADGKAYTDAAVLALIRPAYGFDVIKTQSFCALDKKLTATKVNEAKRTVLEFDHKPAASAYAEALGIPVKEAGSHFMRHPLGLMFGDEPYVRSPQQFRGNDMAFYCNIKEGMELSLLESTDIVSDTRQALAEKKAELNSISGIINFHCILRTLELEQKGQTEAYGNIFSDIPTVGFSTYGEEYIGHINQTSTMLVFR